MKKITLTKFFMEYGHLLPMSYKKTMKAVYDNMHKGAEMIMPDPEGNAITIVKK